MEIIVLILVLIVFILLIRRARNVSRIEVLEVEQLAGGLEDYSTSKYSVKYKQGKREEEVIIYCDGREYNTTKQRVYYNEDGRERGNDDKISEEVDIWARMQRLKKLTK